MQRWIKQVEDESCSASVEDGTESTSSQQSTSSRSTPNPQSGGTYILPSIWTMLSCRHRVNVRSGGGGWVVPILKAADSRLPSFCSTHLCHFHISQISTPRLRSAAPSTRQRRPRPPRATCCARCRPLPPRSRTTPSTRRSTTSAARCCPTAGSTRPCCRCPPAAATRRCSLR